MEHILGYIGWLRSDAMNNRTVFAKATHEWTQIKHNGPITIGVMTLPKTVNISQIGRAFIAQTNFENILAYDFKLDLEVAWSS